MYTNTSINDSQTIAAVAGATITSGAGKAVKYDGNGKIILCSVAGERAIGILPMDTPDSVASGDRARVS